MNLRRKLFAALTAMALAATAVPFAALADEPEDTAAAAAEETVVEILDVEEDVEDVVEEVIEDETETEPVDEIDSASVELLDTTADTSWYNDTDTEFTVSTAAELLGVASIVNAGTDTFEGKTITIDADELNLEDISWTAIGSSSYYFKGTLDGNGCKITNIDKNLFNYIGAGATVKDLDITLAESNTAYYGFAYLVYGSTTALTTIDGITVNGAITGYTGLIYATSSSSTSSGSIRDTEILISNCVNNADVTQTNLTGIGGILCQNNATSVYFKNCENNGDLTLTNTSSTNGAHIGGIIRYVNGSNPDNYYKVTLENCTNTGVLTATVTIPSGDSVPANNIGGLISTAATSVNVGVFEFIDCKNTGNISTTFTNNNASKATNVNANAGGLAGRFNGYNCIVNGFTNTGNISSTSYNIATACAGGVVAYTDKNAGASSKHIIGNASISGTITATSDNSSYAGYVAGYISKPSEIVFFNDKYIGTTETLEDHGGKTTGATVTVAVASIEDSDDTTYYTTLASAVDAAESGSTITVLTDIETDSEIEISEGDSLTLDLNGFTISSSADTAISNTGTLTIADSDGNGAVTATGTTLISSTGTPTITGGTYSSDVSEYAADTCYQVENKDETYTVKAIIDTITEDVDDDEDAVVTIGDPETYQTEDTEVSSDADASDTSSMITGNAVKAAYAETAKEYVEELLAADDTISSITVSRRDEITSYSYDDTTGELTMDIEPYIVYNVNGEETKVEFDLSGVTATVNIPVDNNFNDSDSVKVKHDISSGGAEIKNGTVSDGTVSVETDQGFSTWTIYASDAEDGSAEKISVVYTPVSDDEDNKAYYINLVGDGEIYRFMSAQLVFEIDNDAVGYTIEPYTCDDYTIELTTADTAVGTDTATVYEFNLNGDDVTDITAQKGVSAAQSEYIPIGIVTFAGVVEFTFSVNGDYGENQVQTAEGDGSTTVDNNIVRTYVTADSSISGSDSSTLVADAEIDDSVSLAETTLTINVMFPNAVTAQSIAYTQMSVEYNNVMGGDTVELGNDHSGDDYEDMDIAEISSSINADNWTGYTFEITVPTDYVTKLTFKGDGYRTYRTSIIPTLEDASVTVWNNVMDDEATIVTVNDDNRKTAQTTFLAGDIVANNVIDLYDLSAVVSYFGKTGLDEEDYDDISSYIQYDLNRDGKIDSKDIAMVLVSWGK